MTRADLARLVSAALGRPSGRPEAWPLPDFAKIAAREGVSALALAGARRLELPLSAGEEESLLAEARGAAARGLVLLAAAREIGRAFAAAGLEAILFRGVALLAQGDIGPEERPCGDIDLVVRPADLERAACVLRDGLGFEPVYGTDRTFGRSAVCADLHAKTSDLVLPVDLAEARAPVRVPAEALFARARSSQVEGLLALDGGEHLALLGAHACLVHVLERMVALVDLARLAAAPEFDWARCAGFARDTHLGRPVALALLAGERLGLLDFPDAFERPRPRLLEARLFARALHGRARRDERYLLAIASRFPLGYRLRVAWKALVPPRRALRRAGEPVERVGPGRYLSHWLSLPARLILR